MSSSEIRALIEKAKESLEVATDLVRDEHYDFAASRAYYAMFYIAEALLAELGQSYSRHSAVIAAFGREYSKTKKLPAKSSQAAYRSPQFSGMSVTTELKLTLQKNKPVPHGSGRESSSRLPKSSLRSLGSDNHERS